MGLDRPAKDEALIAKVVELAEAKLRAAYQIATSRPVPRLAARPTPTSRPPDRARRGVRRRRGRRHAVRDRSRHRARRSWPASRIDGRDTRTVRPIEIRNGVLPRTHGSALFTRGETQALVIATLGTERDARRSTRWLASSKTASCCTTTCLPSPPAKWAAWARPSAAKSATAVWPSALWPPAAEQGRVPYTIRVVSEITESNGSSSMASVCGGCLA
jgi:polyribonucleotide nucleotidyltransferase